MTREEFIRKCDERGYRLVGNYENSQSIVSIVCSNGHKFDKIAFGVTGKYFCIECFRNTPVEERIPNKPHKKKSVVDDYSYFYINTIILDGEIYAYKYGCTSRTVDHRIKEIQAGLDPRLTIINHASWSSLDRGIIRACESMVKKTFFGNCILKEHMKDGFTETFNSCDLYKITEFVDNYLKSACDTNSMVIK